MNLSKYHLAAVVWDDAHHSLDEYSLQDIDNQFHKAARETNYGLLIKNDEDGITLACEEGTDGGFRHCFFIPKSMVIEVIDLGLPKRKQVKSQKVIKDVVSVP